jgi:hypothetical protein
MAFKTGFLRPCFFCSAHSLAVFLDDDMEDGHYMPATLYHCIRTAYGLRQLNAAENLVKKIIGRDGGRQKYHGKCTLMKFLMPKLPEDESNANRGQEGNNNNHRQGHGMTRQHFQALYAQQGSTATTTCVILGMCHDYTSL